MHATLTPAIVEEDRPQRLREKPATGGGGFPPVPPVRGGGWGGGGSGDDDYHQGQRYELAVWIAMGGIVMFFAAITSAMVVRRGIGEDWRSTDLPQALWISTALLVISSLTFEAARRQLRQGTLERLRGWVSATALLGAGFLLAQYAGWRELFDRGVFVSTNPSSSFFYLLTAAHGVHLAGGLLALSYVALRVWRRAYWPTRASVIEASALYWHFMDLLWLYLLVLLIIWG